jgi:UPF0042 nucleotide-binding protein
MALELVLITGMSGSGKSVALRALEDAGYFCVDNLPPELLLQFVELEERNARRRVAIAMDVRTATSLPLVPGHLRELVHRGIAVRPLFLDASTDTLVRRFSETRRRHPLSKTAVEMEGDQHRAVVEAIELERELLADLRQRAHVIDTSVLRASQLQEYVKSLLSAPLAQLTLVFESFSYKRGIPLDPHYEPELRDLTGTDAPVIEYLEKHQEVQDMFADIAGFLDNWMEPLARNHRSYVTVGIGCTGGQHRSVYLVEKLCREFGQRWTTLKRHREMGNRRSSDKAA